jgi:hypothetical protein
MAEHMRNEARISNFTGLHMEPIMVDITIFAESHATGAGGLMDGSVSTFARNGEDAATGRRWFFGED